MDKLLVSIYVPTLNKSYDVLIPKELTFKEICIYFQKALNDLSGELFIPSKDYFLSWRDTGEIINPKESPESMGVPNGTQLMLI